MKLSLSDVDCDKAVIRIMSYAHFTIRWAYTNIDCQLLSWLSGALKSDNMSWKRASAAA
jgi:hypothetical protein